MKTEAEITDLEFSRLMDACVMDLKANDGTNWLANMTFAKLADRYGFTGKHIDAVLEKSIGVSGPKTRYFIRCLEF